MKALLLLAAFVAITLMISAQRQPNAEPKAEPPLEALEPAVPEILDPPSIDAILNRTSDERLRAEMEASVTDFLTWADRPHEIDQAPGSLAVLRAALSPPTTEDLLLQGDPAQRREAVEALATILAPEEAPRSAEFVGIDPARAYEAAVNSFLPTP